MSCGHGVPRQQEWTNASAPRLPLAMPAAADPGRARMPPVGGEPAHRRGEQPVVPPLRDLFLLLLGGAATLAARSPEQSCRVGRSAAGRVNALAGCFDDERAVRDEAVSWSACAGMVRVALDDPQISPRHFG